jgi:arsenate reductase
VKGKLRVLFVCVGNACRSQMAEAFARAHGADVLVAASAGLAPAAAVPQSTVRAMREKNIDVRSQFPKSLEYLARARFDLVVNMCGLALPRDFGAAVRNWDVRDPITTDYATHCAIRDEIERRVLGLIDELRARRGPPAATRT